MMFKMNKALLAITLILGWMATTACSDATDVDNGSSGGAISGEGGNNSTMVPMKNGVCPTGTTPEIKGDGIKTGWCESISDLGFIDAAPTPPDAAPLPPDAAIVCLDLEGHDCPGEGTCTLTRMPTHSDCWWDCVGPHEEPGQGAWPRGAPETAVLSLCKIDAPTPSSSEGDAGP